MDDTSRRVGDEMRGRAPEEISGRSDEAVRDYGVTGEYEPSVTDAEVDPRTTEIRRDIEETRVEISETIDAIQEKLRPANIVSSATGRIKHATTEGVRHMAQSAGNAANSMIHGGRSRSGGGLVDSIRENPFPAALIGIGAAWLLMSNRSGRTEDRDDGYNEGYRFGGELSDRDRRARDYRSGSPREDLANYGSEYGTDYSRSGYPRTRSAYGAADEDTSSGGSGLLDRVKNNPVPAALAGIGLGWLAFADNQESDRADYRYGRPAYSESRPEEESTLGEMKETVAGAASSVAEGAEEMTGRAQEYARDASRRARQTGRRTQSELQRMTRENPLAVGAGALLLGAVVGLAIPETEKENELLGETRDSVMDKAQQMAKTATSRAQDAAADLVSDAATKIVSGTNE